MSTKIKRCLFVGLGGTGMRSLLNAKKLLMETYGEVPPMIGFLGVDTDSNVYDKSIDSKCGRIKLDPSEQLSISMRRGNAIAIYSVNKEHFSWIPEENIDALENLTSNGAGQIRSNGRFAFISNYQAIEAKVRSVVNQISRADYAYNPNYELMGGDEIEVHMAFSVCGGTGCGSFIDMAYLIRRVIPQAKVIGYAVLPEVFDAMTENQGEKAFIYQNAFGALQDLDYTMHFSTGKGQKINLDYVNAQLDAIGRPFVSFYFVCNRNENGDVYLHADQLSEMISLAMVTSAGELSGSLTSVSDNLEQVIREGQMNIMNKTAWVAGLGVCEILFRGKDLRSAYATKVERRLITRLLSNTCTDTTAIVDNWIDSPSVHIRENGGPANDQVIDFILPEKPKSELQGINNKQNAMPEVQNYLSSSLVTPKASDIEAKVQELSTRVRKELQKFLHQHINQECGVGLSLDLIEGITRQVDIFLGEMNEELADLQNNQPRLDAAITTAVNMLKDSASGALAFFRRGEIEVKTNDLLAKVNMSARKMRDTLRHQAAITFFNGLKGDLLVQYNKVNTIKQLLKKVAGDCEDQIARNSNVASTVQTFQIDLSEELLKTVSYDDEQIVVSDFLKSLKNIDFFNFDTLSSEAVHKYLYDYSYNLPSAVAKEAKTLDAVIDDMSTEDFYRLLDKAIKKSAPLLSEDCCGYQNQRRARPADSYYIGVRDLKNSRLVKGSEKESEGNRLTFNSLLSGGASVHFANIGSTERIIIFRQFGVIPAYAISGVMNYRRDYDSASRRYHLDVNLYRRMTGEEYDIKPKVEKDDSLELWVKGFIFGYIKWDATKNMYYYKNEKNGKRLHDFWMPLAMFRNDAFADFQRQLPTVRREFGEKIRNLRTQKGEAYVNQLLQQGKDNYYDPQTGNGVGQIMMDISVLESRGNESILELVEREMEFVTNK